MVIAIIALLLGILLPALSKARKNAQQIKCATQVKQIHTGFITQANDDAVGQFYPLPGEINRLAISGTNIPGRGDFNENKNSHQSLYSACVAKIFSQQLCLSALLRPVRALEYVQTTISLNTSQPKINIGTEIRQMVAVVQEWPTS